MSWATERKIIYLFGLIIVLGVIVGVPSYIFTRHPATCFDGVQNQRETGVDCGGPCVQLCTASELSPVILWSRIFTLAPNIYSVTAYIENPNANAESFSVPYTFSFYDDKGQLLGSRSGTTFLPAGQNFAVIESGITASSTPPERTTFQFSAPIKWQAAPNAATDFNAIQIENLTTNFSATSAPRVEADVANTSYQDLPRTDISAILYDASNNAVGVSKTFLDTVPKQSSQHIVFTWISPFVEVPARVELLPVVNEPSTSQP